MIARERLEIGYSLLIITLIPVLFVGNTVLITSKIRNDSDRNIRRNADLVNSVIAESVRTLIEKHDYKAATEQIRSLQKQQPGLGDVFVAIQTNDGFSVVSSTSTSAVSLSQNDRLQLSIIFDRARSAAKRIDATTSDGQQVKGWNVITPLLSSKQKVEAAVSTNVITSDTEALIDNTLTTSFIVTGISVLAIIALLLHHMRIVGYADLLRRQKEVNQTMSDFLGVATHELKAPMSIIKGYIANVLDGMYGEVAEPLKEPLNIAISQTQRLNVMVQDLLNVSRIEQGRLSIDLQPVDMTIMINTVLTNYQQRAAEKGLKLVYTPAQVPAVLADAGRVEEIMTNLIDNAIKYTATGSVTISHRVQGNNLITAVVDTGNGMTPAETARLFQRFYRVKNDFTKDIPGTGLGLWIIKQYAEKMNGKLNVSSIVGVGTEFSVELPLAPLDIHKH
jgi:signal transduction histidine kinase